MPCLQHACCTPPLHSGEHHVQVMRSRHDVVTSHLMISWPHHLMRPSTRSHDLIWWSRDLMISRSPVSLSLHILRVHYVCAVRLLHALQLHCIQYAYTVKMSLLDTSHVDISKLSISWDRLVTRSHDLSDDLEISWSQDPMSTHTTLHYVCAVRLLHALQLHCIQYAYTVKMSLLDALVWDISSPHLMRSTSH